MNRRQLVLTLPMLSLGWTAAAAQDITIEITSPEDGAEVGPQEVVMGTVSDPTVNVWVFVRPTATGVYYPQPQPTVHPTNGSWRIRCHFGDSTTPSGEEFEIVAIATRNAVPDTPGTTLPDRIAQSPPVYVTLR